MTPIRQLVGHPRRGTSRVGVGTAHGTFGELLQGALPGPGEADGEGRFLVTLPVARWSSARFELQAPGTGLTVSPSHKTKATALATALLTELGHPVAGSLVLTSTIPEGKGLASSSADLVATARAVTAVLERSVPARRLGAMLAAIEPTDGVMYPGVVAFDHRRGAHLRTLGHLPALQVVAVDQGGQVDTVAFNRRCAAYGASERRHYERLLGELARAVAAGDLAAVGAVSTESAALNQSRMPNRNFVALRDICRLVGGLGLVACHSGTMIGILLDPRHSGYRSQLSEAVHLAEGLSGAIHLYRTLAA
ncbi:threonine kinase [Micromonospora sediminicola]|uniref:Threonine kinase n=2 Tax=Micromonospora sediminicola TaxID=946078 RepID=A0A1A9B9F2_9ACTN|nr:threonine kinase [Micromonospora sediminicola]